MPKIQTIFSVYDQNGDFDLILKNCVSWKMFWTCSANSSFSSVAQIRSANILIPIRFNLVPFVQCLPISSENVPGVLINDEFFITLTSMRGDEQFIVQQQILIDDND
jgi:hypothetical protein